MKLLGKLLDYIFLSENLCKVCGKEFEPEDQGFICDVCLSTLKPHEFFEDYKDIPYVDSYEFFGKYEGVLREVIILYKFQSVKPLSKIIAKILEEPLMDFLDDLKPDIFTYVPVHFMRWFNRGYDHNEEILKLLNIPYKKILRRKKYARPLAGYGKTERERIIMDAYEVLNPEEIQGKRILVYDDILTTGSTAKYIAKILKESGAKEVHFYFLAKE